MTQPSLMPLSRNSQEWSWPFWFTVPLYPYRNRRTICREVIPDTLWTFDQLQGILYTVVPIRMTIVKLQAGGLLIYAPIAPTPECIRWVKALVADHGEVKYILLPTSSGLEHKVFVGPFARFFPNAQVFVAPHQWSFPVNLPLSWLGFPSKRTHVLPPNSVDAPFGDEFDYAILDIDLGQGAFTEVALYHRQSRSLLLTDTILAVPSDPPAIVQLDPYPLLFHARESALDPITATEANLRKGWQRIALFALYFQPAALAMADVKQAFREALKAPDRSRKAYFGFFPFRWQSDWARSFLALHGNGRPLVAPILQTLILPQDPQQVIEWVARVAEWDFCQIIPCHFEAPIAADSHQFRQAFTFLEPESQHASGTQLTFLEADLQFIKNLEANLVRRGIASPPKSLSSPS
ncbi:MAG: DUF4336 domain-containing protein [Leptolyngbyaceae cyanobacterium bins.59]|nr:DUF4336 domain-containing protein [Leptolyngbyaceae cyanobacterium bins.59]